MNEEIRALFKPIYLSTNDLYNHPIINGQFIVDSLTGAEYLDVLGVRTLLARILFVTYSELLDAQASEDLIPNRFYCITDYRTIYVLNGQTCGRDNDEIQTSVEPLYIKAIDKERLDEANVMSMIYPTDQIVYSLSNDAVNYTDKTYSKGIIISRKDTLNNIYADQDWRNIKFPVMTYNPTKNVVDYTSVQMIPAGKLIRGNGIVGKSNSIFTYGKNKIADYEFTIRESDVFETSLDQFVGKQILSSNELPTYPTFNADDVKDQVFREINSNSLVLDDFENKVWVNMITKSELGVLRNISIQNNPMELTRVILNGSFNTVKITGQDLTIFGSYDSVDINGVASLIEVTNAKYSDLKLQRTSVKAVSIENTNIIGIDSLVNVVDGLENCNIRLTETIIGNFLNSFNVTASANSNLVNCNLIAKKSKLSSVKNSYLITDGAILNTLVKSAVHAEINNSHIYCPWVGVRSDSLVTGLEFTNPSTSQEGVEFGVRYNKGVSGEIGNINSVYNELVNENKYNSPVLVARNVEGENSIWIDYFNSTGIQDTTRIQTILPYDQKITPVPSRSRNRLNRTNYK